VREESARIADLRGRAHRALAGWVDRELRLLEALRARPVLADPLQRLARHHDEIERMTAAARAAVLRGLDRRDHDLEHVRARLATLGPAATLARGYAIVQRVAGTERHVLRSVADVAPGDPLRIRVADGALAARVEMMEP